MNSRIDSLLRILEQNPQDDFVLYALALEYSSQNKPELALPYFEAILKIDAEHIPSLYQGAKVLHQLRHQDECIAWIRRGWEISKMKKDFKNKMELESLYFSFTGEDLDDEL